MGYYGVILNWLPQTTGTTTYSGYASPFDVFLIGYDRPFSQATFGYLSYENVTEADFSARLSLLFNTFWLAAQWNSVIADHSHTNISRFFDDTTGELKSDYQQATVTVIQKISVYNANYVWITVLLIVSVILLLCALASLALRIFAIAPDILGFVSSLTRDSRYFECLSPGGSLLDGEQRARKLRSLKIQIVDVRPEADVGHIAFVPSQVHCDFQRKAQGQARIRKTDSMIDNLLLRSLAILTMYVR